MPDMNSEFYSCCGYGVEISGNVIDMIEGQRGHQVRCKLCAQSFVVPGDLQDARDAIPAHFLAIHQLKGSLEGPILSQM